MKHRSVQLVEKRIENGQPIYVNIMKRHTKANPQKNVKGGVVEREAALHASNVQLVCPECGVRTRIGRRLLDDGRRVRFCVKCKGVVDK